MAIATTSRTLLHQRFQTARDLLDTADVSTGRETRFSTRLRAFDRLLNGGLARGELVELIGRRSSGRFSLVLSTLAATTSMGESTALVDLGDHFDPQQARALGITLERLLWIRPRHLKEALASSEVLISGGFALVVLDLGLAPISGGRGSQSSWQRLSKAVRDQKSVLLISAPYRSSGAAASTAIEARRTGVIWHGAGGSPKLLEALRSRLLLGKARGRPSGSSEELRLSAAGRGFDSGAIKSGFDNVLPMPSVVGCR